MTLLYGFGWAGPGAPRPVVSWPLPAARERSADGCCWAGDAAGEGAGVLPAHAAKATTAARGTRRFFMRRDRVSATGGRTRTTVGVRWYVRVVGRWATALETIRTERRER